MAEAQNRRRIVKSCIACARPNIRYTFCNSCYIGAHMLTGPCYVCKNITTSYSPARMKFGHICEECNSRKATHRKVQEEARARHDAERLARKEENARREAERLAREEEFARLEEERARQEEERLLREEEERRRRDIDNIASLNHRTMCAYFYNVINKYNKAFETLREEMDELTRSHQKVVDELNEKISELNDGHQEEIAQLKGKVDTTYESLRKHNMIYESEESEWSD